MTYSMRKILVSAPVLRPARGRQPTCRQASSVARISLECREAAGEKYPTMPLAQRSSERNDLGQRADDG